MSTIEEILEQAFTDGASDTMWRNDRYIEIFATAKAQLTDLISQKEREARIDELEAYARQPSYEDGDTYVLNRLKQLRAELSTDLTGVTP